tara:strand:+ start:69 stop:464 length:396 start_codon:yes stop_codon:yes gene_type:complete
MALTLEYKVTSLKVKDEVNSEGVTLSNAVCQTYWKVTGTDANGNTGEFSGATPFSAATVASANFKDFADLQEEDVLGWIQAVVDNDAAYKAHIEMQIQRMIDTEITKDAAMPWATDVTPPLPADAVDPAAE